MSITVAAAVAAVAAAAYLLPQHSHLLPAAREVRCKCRLGSLCFFCLLTTGNQLFLPSGQGDEARAQLPVRLRTSKLSHRA